MFCDRLKELRLNAGLSQTELAKNIGASYSAISYWELGINEPKLTYIIALCKYFQVSADYLLCLSDY